MNQLKKESRIVENNSKHKSRKLKQHCSKYLKEKM
jgi:hypothetical protein